METLKVTIEKIWENKELLNDANSQQAIREVIDLLDKGILRVAEPVNNGWQVNEWIKKAAILYFPICKMETVEVGPFEFHDKIPLKKGYAKLGVRVVPHAIARYGSFVAKGTVLMPSYINIGAYVDEGTMVDTCNRYARLGRQPLSPTYSQPPALRPLAKIRSSRTTRPAERGLRRTFIILSCEIIIK